MKALLTACSFCGCGEHCGLVGISGMAKFVVNDVTVLSCAVVMGPAWPGLPGHGGVTVYSTDLHQPGAVPVTHLGTGLHAASGGRSHPDCS